jgi:hypothetical protein
VARVVEGTLRQSAPGGAFTLAVVAALPLWAHSASAAAGAGLAKGAAASGLAAGSVLSAMLGPVLGICGAWMSVKAGFSAARSEGERRLLAIQVRRMVLLGVFSAVSFLGLNTLAVAISARWPGLAVALVTGAPVLYVALVLWLIFRHRAQLRELRLREPGHAPALAGPRATEGATFEYRSRLSFLGLPLVHVLSGRRTEDKMRAAVGWIAIGDVAVGVLVSVGGIACGGISFGGVSLGVVSFGGCSFGLLALGGLSIGAWALGGMAVGDQAVGGFAAGWHAALGEFAAAHHFALGQTALGAHANDGAAEAAISGLPFMRFAHSALRHAWWMIPVWIPMLLVIWQARRTQRVQRERTGGALARPE